MENIPDHNNNMFQIVSRVEWHKDGTKLTYIEEKI